MTLCRLVRWHRSEPQPGCIFVPLSGYDTKLYLQPIMVEFRHDIDTPRTATVWRVGVQVVGLCPKYLRI